MRGLERQMLRFGLVAAVAWGVALVAAHAAGPKAAARQNPAAQNPAAIVLAIAVEQDALATQSFAPDEQSAQPARIDQCESNPHALSDNHLIGDKSAQGAKKRKVVVCG